ncbi:hypothetical protein G210_2826, partial [Candida maltosa Xu316]
MRFSLALLTAIAAALVASAPVEPVAANNTVAVAEEVVEALIPIEPIIIEDEPAIYVVEEDNEVAKREAGFQLTKYGYFAP